MLQACYSVNKAVVPFPVAHLDLLELLGFGHDAEDVGLVPLGVEQLVERLRGKARQSKVRHVCL